MQTPEFAYATPPLVRETMALSDNRPLEAAFPDLLPAKPYCSNDLSSGLRVMPKDAALRRRLVQLNHPAHLRWMPFDIDRPGSYMAFDDANLPPPNVIMVNRDNGHAHAAYLLDRPVAKHSSARLAPLNFYAAVQRGYTNRLGADKKYIGLISKNPKHADWFVEWRRDKPYSLVEMDDWLFERDKKFEPRSEVGEGRNCTIFEELRTFAYREVMRFKASGASLAEFTSRLFDVAAGINRGFTVPVNAGELRAISKSVAKWIWRRFSPEAFVRRQQHLGKKGAQKRWTGHQAAETAKPWVELGISRATFYRRKAAGCL